MMDDLRWFCWNRGRGGAVYDRFPTEPEPFSLPLPIPQSPQDLNDIMMKLRDEHRYCLYCGCQYESAEALEANCPGLYEDDH